MKSRSFIFFFHFFVFSISLGMDFVKRMIVPQGGFNPFSYIVECWSIFSYNIQIFQKNINVIVSKNGDGYSPIVFKRKDGRYLTTVFDKEKGIIYNIDFNYNKENINAFRKLVSGHVCKSIDDLDRLVISGNNADTYKALSKETIINEIKKQGSISNVKVFPGFDTGNNVTVTFD
jgi:hypothetical protein